MIIADLEKKLSRGTAVLLLIFLIFTSTACGRMGEGGYSFEEFTYSDSLPGGTLCVVIPDEASAVLEERGAELSELLADATGMEPLLKRGSGVEGAQTVYLGALNASVYREAVAPLRTDGYLCSVTDGGDLLLGGRNEETTLLALERYLEEFSHLASDQCLLPAGVGFFVESVDRRQDVYLNGYELWRYTIVLEEDNGEELFRLAERLQAMVARRSGYWLEICAEGGRHADREIRLELTEEDRSRAVILPHGCGVTLEARDAYGVSAAALELCRRMFSKADGEIRVELEESYTVSYAHEKLTLSSFLYPWELGEAKPAELSAVCDQIYTSGVGFSLLSPTSEQELSYMKMMLDGYRFVRNGDENSVAVGREEPPTLVRCDRVDSGAICETYAVGDDFGIYLVYVTGVLSEGWENRLPSWLEKSDRPIVILLHGMVGQDYVKLPEQPLSPLQEAASLRYTANGSSYLFACYAPWDDFETVTLEKNASVGHVSVTVSLTSAFH